MTRCKTFRESIRCHPEILDSSRYATHLSRWFDNFGREKVIGMLQEDLQSDYDRYARRLSEHLGLEFVAVPETLKRKVNAAALPPSVRLAAVGLWGADKLRNLGLYGIIETAKWAGLKRLFFGKPNDRRVPTLLVNDRCWLLRKLLPEIEQLEEMLGIDLSAWKNI